MDVCPCVSACVCVCVCVRAMLCVYMRKNVHVCCCVSPNPLIRSYVAHDSPNSSGEIILADIHSYKRSTNETSMQSSIPDKKNAWEIVAYSA